MLASATKDTVTVLLIIIKKIKALQRDLNFDMRHLTIVTIVATRKEAKL